MTNRICDSHLIVLAIRQETHSTVSAGMKLTDGYQSMTGCGRTIPDPRDNIKLEDGVVLALGRGIPSERLTSGFQYNEYPFTIIVINIYICFSRPDAVCFIKGGILGIFPRKSNGSPRTRVVH